MFWNGHEPKPTPGNLSPPPNEYDFSGRHDLFGFIAAAGTAGLHVILRIGPYVCAEVSYGGFPSRLRDVEGLRFRTWNEPFMREVETWVRYVAGELRSRELMAPEGGPVILVQLENEYSMVSEEYGDEGVRYLQWVADLQKDLRFGVPAIMCYGAADGVVETINSFKASEELEGHRQRHPDQPPVWTECWTGWYDVWGAATHRREVAELAYCVARFFADGGAGVNYYMWMGGTNWGRDGMYLQKSSYDYDAPVDEFYRGTVKSRMLTKLHDVLVRFVEPVLSVSEAKVRKYPVGGENGIVAFELSDAVLFYCNDTESALPLVVSGVPEGTALSPKCVQIRKCGSNELLFDSSVLPVIREISKPVSAIASNSDAWVWESVREPLPTTATVEKIAELGRGKRNLVLVDKPPEQVALTRDASDYCFYTADYEVCGDGEVTLTFEAGDYAHVYVNGAFAGRTDSEAPWEDRYTNTWTKHEGPDPGMKHKVVLKTSGFDVGACVSVTVLVVSLGLVKGDWQLGRRAHMEHERKGLLSEPVVEGDVWRRVGKWHVLPHTHGECVAFDGEQEAFWEEKEGGERETPSWWHTSVTVPMAKSWQIDLGKQGKGVLWVNGVCIGRFWNIAGVRGRCGFLDGSPIVQTEKGQMCQRQYHVPGWVVDGGDGGEATLEIVLLDEFGCVPNNGENLLTVVVPQE